MNAPGNVHDLPEALKGKALPEVLLSYQQRLLATTAANPVTICEKSRRIGITWAIAADAVLTAGAARGAGGMDVLYIGYNLDMAREFVDTAAMWARSFTPAAAEVEEFLFADQDEKGIDRAIQAFRIRFASGFEIVALSSKPRSLRGRQGYLIFDEAAFHDDLAGMMKAGLAFLMWGGRILVISTHDGEANPFAELVAESRAGRKPYKVVRITFDDAIADGLYERVKLMSEARGLPVKPKDQWIADIRNAYGEDAAEELDVVPAQGSGTFLTSALIEARMSADVPVIRWEMPADFAEKPDAERESVCADWCEENLAPLLAALDPTARSFVGEDFARSGDLTDMWPLLLLRNMHRMTPFLVELRNIPFRQQEQILYFICDRLPRFTAGALDARGNGQYLAERAMQKYGALRIAQVMLSAEWYRENMPPYRAAFEDATITLPKDADVHADHRMLKMIKGVAMIPETRVQGTDKKKRHGDSAIAGALAYFASRMDVHEYDYTPAPPARGRYDERGAEDDDGVDSGLRRMRGAI